MPGCRVDSEKTPGPMWIRGYALALAIAWTAAIAASLWWEARQHDRESRQAALAQARAAFDMDDLFRHWNSSEGGVYVPATEDNPPNPYLASLPERDVTTPSGRCLTLVNSAYMLRQAHQLGGPQKLAFDRLCSLQPIRPENAADSWEQRALESLEGGVKEVAAIEKIGNESYMRMIRPLYVEQVCLNCHGQQGYKLGDLRGGHSLAVPMSSVMTCAEEHREALLYGHAALWILGLTLMGFGARAITNRATALAAAREEALVGMQAADRAKASMQRAQRHLQRFRAALDTSADLIFLVDRTTMRFVDVNDTTCKVLGYSRHELLAMGPHDIDPIAPRDPTAATIAALIDSGHETVETFYRRKDGSTFPVEIRLRAQETADGPLLIATARDMTQRKRDERALRESEELFRSITTRALDAIIMMDHEGRLSYWNESAERIFGYSWDEVRGRNLHTLLAPPQYREGYEKGVDRFCATGEGPALGKTAALTALRKSGEEFPVELSVSGIMLSGQRYAVGILRDVSERKRAEDELKAAHAFLQKVIDSIPSPVYYKDGQGRYLGCNVAFEHLLNRPRAEIIGKTIFDFWPPDMAQLHAEQATRALQGAGHQSYEAAIPLPDGTMGDAIFIKAAFLNPDGQVGGVVAVILDITERKRAEAQQRRLVRAIEAAADAVVLTDAYGLITNVNPAFTVVTGYTEEEAIGHQLLPLLNAGEGPALGREITEAAKAGKVWSGRRTNRRKDGTLYHAAVTVAPVAGENGEITGYVAIERDVSEDILREEQLRDNNAALCRSLEREKLISSELAAASAAAQAATRAKSEFLANMSHEIRTPMSAILGFADLLDESLTCCSECPRWSGCDERATNRQYVDTIRRNGRFLLDIINDILDLSKIEAGKLTTETIECAPCAIVSEVASLMSVRAQAKNLAIKIEYAGPVPERIQTDPMRLRQILINLIGNAIKFTDFGEVRLVTRFVPGSGTPTARRLAGPHREASPNTDDDSAIGPDGPGPSGLEFAHRPAPGPSLQFDVIDTGVGLKPEHLSKLFQPFTQADASMARRFGGTGLGLTISSRLAEMLGGQITVESEFGEGSTFRLTIAVGSVDGIKMIEPTSELVAAAAQTAPRPAQRKPVSSLGCRVLLAEDGPDNRQFISFVLRRAGADVVMVENGEQAVDAVLATMKPGTEAATPPFDLVLMDMQMPGMDGYEATLVLRNHGYTGPIVALTAHAMAGDRRRCLDAGCNDYAVKPISRHALVGVLERHLTGRWAPVNASRAEPDADTATATGHEGEHDQAVALLAELEARINSVRHAESAEPLQELTAVIRRLRQLGGAAEQHHVANLLARLTAGFDAANGLEKVSEELRKLANACQAACRFKPRNAHPSSTDEEHC
ncbi:MAG TPA: PAS domain S-box protein [Phycisphaerae bacterium]|nr:PAS domain S-box protein [Phycisphaerae bacterium]